MTISPISPIKRFWNLLSLYKLELRQIYAYAIFIGIVNLTLPLGIQAIINYIQTGEISSSWIILVAFVLIGIAITGVLQVLQLRVVENIQQDLFTRSGLEFAYRIPQIRLLNLDELHAPELVNRFFDTLTIQKGLPKILIDFSLALFQIVFGLLLLTIYSPYFIILGVTLLLIVWLIFQFTGPQGLKSSLKESKYKYKMAHWLEEVGRLNTSFKMYGADELHLEKADKIAVDYLIARESHFKVLINQFRLFIAFKVFVAAGLLILGGILVFNQEMNIGQFVAAEIIIILVINSVEKILRVVETIYDVLTALEKIGFVTDLELEENVGKLKLEKEEAISIQATNINFSFPDSDNKILDNLSFEIPANSKTLLTGKSGSGKSILLKILAGLLEIKSGGLYLNNIPVKNFEKENLFKSLAYSPPTNQIFEGSFRDNIVMGREVPEKKLRELINILRLKEYISMQAKGIETMIDSGGKKLPRSIIQKVQIARLVLQEPKLLIIEDPLQFVEVSERIEIIDYLTSLNCTLIVVADHKYWSEKCNQIINLENKQ